MDELLEKKKYDRTYVEIDLEAIKHNIRCEREKVGDKVKIMAIIKANAYGHGDIEVAEALKDEVDAYGVAIIEEALKLRKAGVTKMILILGHTGKIWYDDLIKNDISQAVYSYEMAKILSEEAMRLGKKAKIHIKVDTGMGRIGFQPVKDNIEVIYAISRLPGIEIEGIFTHFARADEVSTEWTKEPFEKFQIFRHELQKRGVEIPLAHVANSASILRLPSTYLDMVRSGITTYGLFPSDEVKKNVTDESGKTDAAAEWMELYLDQHTDSGNQKAIEIGEKARLSVLWKLADAYERSGMKTEQIQTYGQLIEWEQDPIQLEEAGVRKMKLEAAQGDYKQAAETGKKVLERIEASEKITKMLKGYELYKGEEGES